MIRAWVALLSCGGCLWCLYNVLHLPGRVWNEAALEYQVPDVPHEFDRAITYLDMVTHRDVTVDGASEYLGDHEWGWRDCRECFYENASFEGQTLWDAPDDHPLVSFNVIHAPGHVVDAFADGWRQCRSQISLKLRSNLEGELRSQLVVSQDSQVMTLSIAAVALGTIGTLATANCLVRRRAR